MMIGVLDRAEAIWFLVPQGLTLGGLQTPTHWAPDSPHLGAQTRGWWAARGQGSGRERKKGGKGGEEWEGGQRGGKRRKGEDGRVGGGKMNKGRKGNGRPMF